MTSLKQCTSPGILLVFARPTSPSYEKAFHEWYDTEHGPARLRLGNEYFANGLRYRSINRDVWMAIYDMNNLSMGADPKYTSLRLHRSGRELEIFRKALKVLSRQFLKLEHVAYGDFCTLGSSDATAPSITHFTFQVRHSAFPRTIDRYSKSLKSFLEDHKHCARSRLFRLVEGDDHGLDLGDTLFTVILDWRINISRSNFSAITRSVEQLLDQTDSQFLTLLTIENFSFHRAFSADEYLDPPDVIDIDGSKETQTSSKM